MATEKSKPNRKKLTDPLVKKIRFSNGVYTWDTGISQALLDSGCAFGVRAYPDGRKSWVIRYRANRRPKFYIVGPVENKGRNLEPDKAERLARLEQHRCIGSAYHGDTTNPPCCGCDTVGRRSPMTAKGRWNGSNNPGHRSQICIEI